MRPSRSSESPRVHSLESSRHYVGAKCRSRQRGSKPVETRPQDSAKAPTGLGYIVSSRSLSDQTVSCETVAPWFRPWGFSCLVALLFHVKHRSSVYGHRGVGVIKQNTDCPITEGPQAFGYQKRPKGQQGHPPQKNIPPPPFSIEKVHEPPWQKKIRQGKMAKTSISISISFSI